MSKLKKIAISFRNAIVDAIDNGDIREINMLNFPDGCCAYASNLLQHYLAEQDIITMYMSGHTNTMSHAWLETKDGIVIDITCDQKEIQKVWDFNGPVYVGTRANGFHNRFHLDEPIEYHLDESKYVHDMLFDKRYRAVMKHLL